MEGLWPREGLWYVLGETLYQHHFGHQVESRLGGTRAEAG